MSSLGEFAGILRLPREPHPEDVAMSAVEPSIEEGKDTWPTLANPKDPFALSAEERKEAKRLFHEGDVDGNGELDLNEFSKVLDQICPGLDEDKKRAAFESIDTDGTGLIDFDEFMAGQAKIGRRRATPKASSGAFARLSVLSQASSSPRCHLPRCARSLPRGRSPSLREQSGACRSCKALASTHRSAPKASQSP